MPSPPEPPDLTSPIGPWAATHLKGSSFGRVYPGPVSPSLQHRDARGEALRTFAQFISLLRFTRTGETPEGPPIRFTIPAKNIHVYQPDDVQLHDALPGIGILPGRAQHQDYGLGPAVMLDETADLFGPDLVLIRRSDHVETLAIEVVVDKAPVREGVVAGLKEALQMDDKSQALRLVCPNYYGLVASFRLDESESIDDADGTLNRRRAHLFVMLQVQEVSLVAYRKTHVSFESEVTR